MLVHGLHHHRFPFLVQGNGLLLHIKILVIDLFAGKEVDNGLLTIDAEGLNEIENQRLLVVTCVSGKGGR